MLVRVQPDSFIRSQIFRKAKNYDIISGFYFLGKSERYSSVKVWCREQSINILSRFRRETQKIPTGI